MTPAPSSPSTAPRTLLDDLLRDQGDLSAVARFARWHERAPAEPDLARHYRALIPLTRPRPGEQYGFEVDLDACSGCKACVTACHALNGLDDSESWRRVGLLVGPPSVPPPIAQPAHPRQSAHSVQPGSPTPSAPLLQHVTAACHHCLEPACLHGCPVLAYDKDPVTGIVRHLDDQCIGCSYCVMMCPYEVPQYSPRLGIVRKCDLCQGRLADAEAPACVQACPTEAIRVRLVDRTQLAASWLLPAPLPSGGTSGGTSSASPHSIAPTPCGLAKPSPPIAPPPLPSATPPNPFLPASPSPTLTLPTTRYLSRRHRLDHARAADAHLVQPAPAHPSLVAFLTLSQLSVGWLTLHALLSLLPSPAAVPVSPGPILPILLLQLVALALATLHLGQPLRAWRAFLGWRTSWFSREVIAFGAYAGLLTATAFASYFPALAPWTPGLTAATAACGLAGVVSSAMIYAATRRRFWNLPSVAGRFLGATLALGATAVLAGSPAESPLTRILASLALAGIALGAAAEWIPFRRRPPSDPELARSAALLRAPFLGLWTARGIAAGLATTGLATVLAGATPLVAWPILLALALGIVLERHLFFVAVAPDRMPGGIAS
ncbi:MAG: dimethyl sulfoxide reductase anchor subunit [Verrucomicrobiae bacterium]|nr:dimethyl sulfoxide reductase anchor subunit [Verrucomicrobiae bacterium]